MSSNTLGLWNQRKKYAALLLSLCARCHDNRRRNRTAAVYEAHKSERCLGTHESKRWMVNRLFRRYRRDVRPHLNGEWLSISAGQDMLGGVRQGLDLGNYMQMTDVNAANGRVRRFLQKISWPSLVFISNRALPFFLMKTKLNPWFSWVWKCFICVQNYLWRSGSKALMREKIRRHVSHYPASFRTNPTGICIFMFTLFQPQSCDTHKMVPSCHLLALIIS